MTDAEHDAATKLDDATARAIPLVEEAAWFAVDVAAEQNDTDAQATLDALVATLSNAAQQAFWSARRDGAI